MVASGGNIIGMSLTSLYVVPLDPFLSPDRARVLTALSDLAVIGEVLGEDTFAAGEGFSRHIVFAGCSPYLVTTPPTDDSRQFCHVAIHGPLAAPHLATGPNTVKPRCPRCRERLADWQEQREGWGATGRPFRCRGCGADAHPCEFDWRGQAACARFLVELRNVFPGEAAPSDLLLRTLQETTSHPWHYAWAGYLEHQVTVRDQPTTT